MAQGPIDTILALIRIMLRIRESKVWNPDPPDRRRFVLSEHIFLFTVVASFMVAIPDFSSALTCISVWTVLIANSSLLVLLVIEIFGYNPLLLKTQLALTSNSRLLKWNLKWNSHLYEFGSWNSHSRNANFDQLCCITKFFGYDLYPELWNKNINTARLQHVEWWIKLVCQITRKFIWLPQPLTHLISGYI